MVRWCFRGRYMAAAVLMTVLCGCYESSQNTGGTSFDPPAWCPPPQSGRQEIDGTPASPYFVDHPSGAEIDVPTVIFLPGGNGGWSHADGTWAAFFEGSDGIDRYRVVMPFSSSSDFPSESGRTMDVLEEVFTCYGGDPGKVHLGGHSNGGYAAFDLLLENSQYFATLLGAPGLFSAFSSQEVTEALEGKAVFNGVGEYDTSWQPAVAQLHEQLELLGLDSRYVEFAGQGHTPNVNWSGKDVLFDFWDAH